MIQTREFEVICAEESDGSLRWADALAGGEVARPQDELRYLELMGPPGWHHRLATYQTDKCRIVYPFHLLPLDRTVFGDAADGRSVVSSPYGYGGPLLLEGQASAAESDAFYALLDEWLAHEGVVTEFVRADIHPSRLVVRAGNPGLHIMENVSVPLRSEKPRWNTYEHKVRKNVRRARESGVSIEFGVSSSHVELFHDVYLETMERAGAAEHFKMPLDAFTRYVSNATGNCSFVFAIAKFEGVCISAEMILIGSREGYSFLGGTRASAFAVRPNDLLKHEAILYLTEMGLAEYVLGGGVAPDDGIFKYKRGFAPDGVVPFCVVQVVHDSAVAGSLVDARRRHDRGWVPRDGYFPPFMA